jgi:hypothetical protein
VVGGGEGYCVGWCRLGYRILGLGEGILIVGAGTRTGGNVGVASFLRGDVDVG